MMSYGTALKDVTAASKSTWICCTEFVSVLPLVPPTSILASFENWTIVSVRSRMSWQRSRNESNRMKSALFWMRHGFSGHSAFAVALYSKYVALNAPHTRSVVFSFSTACTIHTNAARRVTPNAPRWPAPRVASHLARRLALNEREDLLPRHEVARLVDERVADLANEDHEPRWHVVVPRVLPNQ